MEVAVRLLIGLAGIAGPVILAVRYFKARDEYDRARAAFLAAAEEAGLGRFAMYRARFQARKFAFEESRGRWTALRQDALWSFGLAFFFLKTGGVAMAPVGFIVGVIISMIITIDNMRTKATDPVLLAKARKVVNPEPKSLAKTLLPSWRNTVPAQPTAQLDPAPIPGLRQ